jgi:hypothetical protein
VENLEYKEKILKKSSVCYLKDMLFLTNDDGLTILKEDDNAFATVKKFPKEDRPFLWAWILNLSSTNENSARLKEFYGKRKGLIRMDLETLEIEEIDEWKDIKDAYYSSLRFLAPDRFYFVEADVRARTIKIFKLEGRQKTFLKTFENFDFERRNNRFEIHPGGIVIQRGNKLRVYSLPDFQEIKFKKLG